MITNALNNRPCIHTAHDLRLGLLFRRLAWDSQRKNQMSCHLCPFLKQKSTKKSIIPKWNKWAWAECDELIFLVFSSHSGRSHVSSPPLCVTPARATVKETMYFSSLQTAELLSSGTPLCTITVSTKKLRIYHDSTTSYLQYIDVKIYSNLRVLFLVASYVIQAKSLLTSAVILQQWFTFKFCQMSKAKLQMGTKELVKRELHL